MLRLTIRMVALTLVLTPVPALVLVALGAPATARAAGCEVLRDPRDRTECEARAVAREAARDEVERQLAGGASAGMAGDTTGGDTSVSAADPSRSADWQDAVREANGFDPGALLDVRPLAAVGGIAWFVIAVRVRRRRAARSGSRLA
ncbi:MAG: hypothetical protein JWL76_1406 [Thermoleophilia bacterium]|nr:hypothetical protein [Thermoleophilia bacterium]